MYLSATAKMDNIDIGVIKMLRLCFGADLLGPDIPQYCIHLFERRLYYIQLWTVASVAEINMFVPFVASVSTERINIVRL